VDVQKDILSVDVSRSGSCARIVCCGEIDFSTAGHVQEAIHSSLAPVPRSLVVDLTGVSFFSSPGTKMLVDLATRCKAQKTTLEVNAGRCVWTALEVAGGKELVRRRVILRLTNGA
jgi:anti-sigma B factor antagonist